MRPDCSGETGELVVIHFQTDMDFIMDKHRLGVCLVSF